ncbi:hypothetical protein LINGRAHAP2_LOCUS19449 [Linum grandiflorum]
MATSTTTKITLKLVINKKAKKVLFAEAGKDFIDFLFTLLSLPLGTVTSLLSKNRMVGCLGNLYQSIEQLSETFIQPTTNKDSVLNPKPTLFGFGGDDNNPSAAVSSRMFYNCNYYNCGGRGYISDDPRAICPGCHGQMNNKITLIVPPAAVSNSGERGFVKEDVTYMVMDNLEVRPMSNISSIAMLKEFNVHHVSALEEKVIEVGMDEGLKLLKASMQSRTVLTNVLLRGWLG